MTNTTHVNKMAAALIARLTDRFTDLISTDVLKHMRDMGNDVLNPKWRELDSILDEATGPIIVVITWPCVYTSLARTGGRDEDI